MFDTVHTWKHPVTIKLGGAIHEVTGPGQARTILLQQWPAERTDLHKIASDACLAATEGANPEPSYLAFLETAIEAGIFLK